jgi:hypothetical protein
MSVYSIFVQIRRYRYTAIDIGIDLGISVNIAWISRNKLKAILEDLNNFL